MLSALILCSSTEKSSDTEQSNQSALRYQVNPKNRLEDIPELTKYNLQRLVIQTMVLKILGYIETVNTLQKTNTLDTLKLLTVKSVNDIEEYKKDKQNFTGINIEGFTSLEDPKMKNMSDYLLKEIQKTPLYKNTIYTKERNPKQFADKNIPIYKKRPTNQFAQFAETLHKKWGFSFHPRNIIRKRHAAMRAVTIYDLLQLWESIIQDLNQYSEIHTEESIEIDKEFTYLLTNIYKEFSSISVKIDKQIQEQHHKNMQLNSAPMLPQYKPENILIPKYSEVREYIADAAINQFNAFDDSIEVPRSDITILQKFLEDLYAAFKFATYSCCYFNFRKQKLHIYTCNVDFPILIADLKALTTPISNLALKLNGNQSFSNPKDYSISPEDLHVIMEKIAIQAKHLCMSLPVGINLPNNPKNQSIQKPSLSNSSRNNSSNSLSNSDDNEWTVVKKPCSKSTSRNQGKQQKDTISNGQRFSIDAKSVIFLDINDVEVEYLLAKYIFKPINYLYISCSYITDLSILKLFRRKYFNPKKSYTLPCISKIEIAY
ncbi:hypothetical protein NEOKW01_1611 [Nematocida sp. AWRm80]|nr:hypothetical protein NEOKW01_1611 [Nematocida sp. AWRm80]